MKKDVIIVLLVLLMTSSCEHRSIWDQLDKVESLTDHEQFDSAYIELSKIKLKRVMLKKH